MSANAKFYVYVLRTAGERPFYVGKGSGTRAMHHLVRRDRAGGPAKQDLIDQAVSAGEQISIDIVGWHDSKDAALRQEREIVKELGAIYGHEGPLTNMRPCVGRGGITPNQCRGTRHWLGWSCVRLAEAAGLGRNSVVRFEAGNDTQHSTCSALLSAFERNGFRFPDRFTIRRDEQMAPRG